MSDVQHERYLVFTLADYRMQSIRLFFIELHRAAVRQHLHIAKEKVRMFGNHVAAARTGTAQNAAPVRVFAEHSALGQVRRTNEASHAQSLFVAFGLFDAKFNELGRTFTIANDILGEFLHHKHQCSAEFTLFGESQVFVLDAAHAVCKQDAGIVRTRITVNRNRVERVSDVGAEFSKEINRESEVSRNEGKHRRHVRVNHARTLAGATDSHHTLFGLDFNGMALERKVSRQDGTTKFFGSIGTELFDQFRNTGFDLVHRHQVTNHAGAADENTLRSKLQGFFGEGSHTFCIAEALFAGTGVSITAIHHHGRSKVCMFECSLVVKHRSSLHLVRCKHGKATSRLFTLQKRHVGIAAGLDTCANSRRGETLRGADAAFFQYSVHRISYCFLHLKL